MDAYLGEIRLVGFKYAPENWLPCNGAFLDPELYPELFEVIGYSFGQSGLLFALPNLQGRGAMGQGIAPVLPPRKMGDTGGYEQIALTSDQMPNHFHVFNIPASNAEATLTDPTAAFYGNPGSPRYCDEYEKNDQLQGSVSSYAGSDEPHENMPPFQVLNYIICSNSEIIPIPAPPPT
jgi:microcystin-dependent protein